MDINFEAKVCHIGFTIEFLSKDHIRAWADKVIELLEVTDIPHAIFDLAMVNKDEAIPPLLIQLGANMDEEKALKTVVGLINSNYKNGHFTLYETCEFLYQISNYVDIDHHWNRYLYLLTGNLEVALDGYGEVEAALKEVEDFLSTYEDYSSLFELTHVPNKPILKEFNLRKEQVVIDASKVFAPSDFHSILKRELGFPDFYGMNWDAFWDAITGLVKMPKTITITGWDVLEERFPEVASTFKELINKYNVRYSNENFTVVYEKNNI